MAIQAYKPIHLRPLPLTTAWPWPQDQAVMAYWIQMYREASRPARPYPAAPYKPVPKEPEYTPPPPWRQFFSKPKMTRRELVKRGYGRIVRYTNTSLGYTSIRYVPYPWPKQLAHRILNKLIAWRRSLRRDKLEPEALFVRTSGKSHGINWQEGA